MSAATGVRPAAASHRCVRTPDDAARLGTVLGVWAHPDDETYLSGGLMALARQCGNPVVMATATPGEHGTDDPVAWPPARLARTRVLEARAAMAVLGVTEHRWFGLEDGTLRDVDPRLGAARVEALIAEIEPDTIVTFGPDGMTGHPDHIAISNWVRAAWARAGGRARLLQATTTASFADEFADLHATLGLFPPGLPVRAADDEIAMTVELDDALSDRKLAALRSYATQIGPVIETIGAERLRTWFLAERFREVLR
jgi:LmbE family N-acetylglucosaminyl deacetylase